MRDLKGQKRHLQYERDDNLPVLWECVTKLFLVPLLTLVCSGIHQDNFSKEEYPWWSEEGSEGPWGRKDEGG